LPCETRHDAGSTCDIEDVIAGGEAPALDEHFRKWPEKRTDQPLLVHLGEGRDVHPVCRKGHRCLRTLHRHIAARVAFIPDALE
jgi:hypothetical protein